MPTPNRRRRRRRIAQEAKPPQAGHGYQNQAFHEATGCKR